MKSSLLKMKERSSAFTRWFLLDGKAELDHLWVSPERIGSGVGKELFVHAMRKAAGQDAV